MLLVTAVGCGSSGGGKKTVEVRPDEEIGESGELTVSSLDELSFDRNKDGIITASEISDIVPDFALYNFGDVPGAAGFHRSVCVDYLYYNPDGTIRPVIPTVSQEKLRNNTAYSPRRSE